MGRRRAGVADRLRHGRPPRRCAAAPVRAFAGRGRRRSPSPRLTGGGGGLASAPRRRGRATDRPELRAQPRPVLREPPARAAGAGVPARPAHRRDQHRTVALARDLRHRPPRRGARAGHAVGGRAARVHCRRAGGAAALAGRPLPPAAGRADPHRVGAGRPDGAGARPGRRAGADARAVPDRQRHPRLGRTRAEPDRAAGRGDRGRPGGRRRAARRAAAELREAAAQATTRLHDVIGVLREDSDAIPVLPADDTLAALVERAQASGMPITVTGEPPGRCRRRRPGRPIASSRRRSRMPRSTHRALR